MSEKENIEDPQGSTADPQESAANPQESAADPQESAANPQESAANPQESAANPQESAADPQESAANPQFKKRSSMRTLSLRTNINSINRFNSLKGFETARDFLNKLLDNYENPPEPKVIEKEIEKVVKQTLPAGHIIVPLSAQQISLLEAISMKRFERRAKLLRSGSGPIQPESPGAILMNAFFIEDRLFNLDNAFKTYLSSKDLKNEK